MEEETSSNDKKCSVQIIVSINITSKGLALEELLSRAQLGLAGEAVQMGTSSNDKENGVS